MTAQAKRLTLVDRLLLWLTRDRKKRAPEIPLALKDRLEFFAIYDDGRTSAAFYPRRAEFVRLSTSKLAVRVIAWHQPTRSGTVTGALVKVGPIDRRPAFAAANVQPGDTLQITYDLTWNPWEMEG